jgi:hypothetical protein
MRSEPINSSLTSLLVQYAFSELPGFTVGACGVRLTAVRNVGDEQIEGRRTVIGSEVTAMKVCVDKLGLYSWHYSGMTSSG